MPSGFIPQQDKGYLLVNVQLPDGASVERTREVMRRIEQIARETHGRGPHGGHFGAIAAAGRQRLELRLDVRDARRVRPAARRRAAGDAIAADLRDRCQQEVREALVSIFGAPPVDGLGNAGGFKLIVEDRGNLGLGELQTVADDIVAKGNDTPGLARRLHQPPRRTPPGSTSTSTGSRPSRWA